MGGARPRHAGRADPRPLRESQADPSSRQHLVGPCDLRGDPTGDPVPATAEITDAATGARYRSLIARKYGIVGRLMIFNSWLRGADRTLGIRVRLAP